MITKHTLPLIKHLVWMMFSLWLSSTGFNWPPKFEACKAVVLVIVTQVQPFLHGSNSTKMRIKESTIMIRSSLLLSQSDTLIRTWWISFLLYFILCYHVMFALKLEKFRLQNLRILTLLLLLRNSLSFFLFFLLFMCSNS